MTGQVIAIYIADAGEGRMRPLAAAELQAGRGINGDRYHALLGTFSRPPSVKRDQQITLIESEQIDEFNRATGLTLDYGAARRNVVTAGVRLNDLVGVRFAVGGAVLEGIRLCEPCTHLARLVSDQVLPALVHRAGLRASIVSGGTVKPSDRIARV